MADATVPGLGDLFSLFGAANPLGGIGKQLDQFKRLSSELVTAVENINRTMESLNGTVQRVNGLIDDVEAPIRALMPQLTRSINAMDSVANQLTGPLELIAPGLTRLAGTLSSPVLDSFPNDLAGFVAVLGDVAKRLQPLTQLAESAGSLFGLRPLANLRAGSGRLVPTPPPAKPAAQVVKPAAPLKKQPAADLRTPKAMPSKGTTTRKSASPATTSGKKSTRSKA